MAIARIDVLPYHLPFARPVHTAAGAFAHRDGWVLKVTAEDGVVGFGDCAPWPGFGSGHERVHAAIDAGDLEASDLIEIRGAIATALADIAARRRNIPLARYLAPEARLSVATHKMVQDAAEATAAVRLGYRVLKVKVAGAPVADDVKRITAIREAVGKHVRLRLDANAGWSVADAVSALTAMVDVGLDLVEQPVAGIDDLLHVRARCRVRIAADESVTDAASLERIIRAQAADVVVLKPAFLGGVVATRDLINTATADGMHCIVTHALESAVGRAAAIHLACALPDAPVCGLASSLGRDLAIVPEPVESRVAHPRGPGLGLTPLEQS
jgi:o-succinylbenzoate synthase